MIRSPFSLLYMKRKGMPLEYSPRKHGEHHWSLGYWSATAPRILPCLRVITTTALLVEATEDIVAGSPLTIFVPHAVEALLNLHHTQHLSVRRLLSYEILLLTAPHTTLSHCNNLNPATLLPSETNEAPHDCLALTDHLLSPCHDLQETPLGKAVFPWFPDGSCFRNGNGKYCAGYAIEATEAF